MKILIHDYAGHPFPIQLSRELAGRGHEVTHAYAGELLTPRGALERQSGDSDSLSIVKVPMNPDYRASKYNFLKRRSYEVAYGRELRSLVHRVSPDVIISGNTPTEPQWTMISAATRMRVPVVSWVQDFYSIALEKLASKKAPVLGRLAAWWYRMLDARCFRRSAAIVAITHDFVPILRRYGVDPDKIVVIPNWGPLNELPVRPRSNPWSTARGLEDKFVFLYAGTLAMKHNPELLVRLAKSFRDSPEVRIVVISEGPGAGHLARARDEHGLRNLDLLDFLPMGEMPEAFASADVLVAMLEQDAGVFSVPSKVLSYHCARRPVLAAMPLENLAARIVLDEKSGIVVQPGNVGGFLEGAARLRRNAWMRERMSAKARAYAEANFDIVRIAHRFEAVARAAFEAAAMRSLHAATLSRTRSGSIALPNPNSR